MLRMRVKEDSNHVEEIAVREEGRKGGEGVERGNEV